MSKTDKDYSEENARLEKQLAEVKRNKELRQELDALEATDGEGEPQAERHDELPSETIEKDSLGTLKLAGIAVVGLALAIGLAVLFHFVLQPKLAESEADRSLQQISDYRGSIRPTNGQLLPFTGQKVEDANAEQKALGANSRVTDPPAFIFSSGKDYASKKKLDIYVDFSQQTSRDFVLLNQGALKDMVENGAIDLYVHPVPGGKTFSIYGPEAVAEAIYASQDGSDASWNYLVSVLKLSAEVESDGLDNDEIAEALAKRAGEEGIRGIDRESIQNGTFASWILSVASDSRLTSGVTLPAVYLDEVAVNTSDLDLNDSDALRRYVSNN